MPVKRPDRLDTAVLLAAVLLLIVIAITIAVGDRAGVAIISVYPTGTTNSVAAIRIAFAEPMDVVSVQSRLVIEPPVEGQVRWSGAQLTFKPVVALASGRYTITLRAGARSQQNRPLLEDYRWSFEVRPPRVVYLAPAVQDSTAAPSNLWVVDPHRPFDATQLTFSRTGLLPDFAVSPDGTRIAYAEKGPRGTGDLYVLTLDTKTVQRITRCADVDALCQAPSWSPEGTRLTYERIEMNTALQQLDRGVPRAWIVNLADLNSTPLIASSQALGHAPRWSPDGSQIAVYDQSLRAIVVYVLSGTDGKNKQIESLDGESGVFDATGSRLIFPRLQETPQGFFTALAIAYLADPSKGIKLIVDPNNAQVEDRQAAWHPDGKQIAITRKRLDEKTTPGTQVYLIDVDSNTVQSLIFDASYNHGAISFDPTGSQLVVQRYPYFGNNPQPGIWVYNLQDKTLRHIARNGFLPQWLP